VIVLGADLGGTACRVALFDGPTERGRAEGIGGAMRSGLGATRADEIAALAAPLLHRAGIARADVLVVGAAGAGREQEREELDGALAGKHLAWRTVVTTDAELARAAAFGTAPGILLIAGTGSIAIGRDAQGTARRSGGLGWRMGDQGSGYWLGQRALHAVGAMHDGLGPATHLTEALCAAAGVQGIAGLVRWSTTATPAAVASLAPATLQTAESGDPVAVEIRHSAVEALCRLARSAGAGPGAAPVAFSGGLIAPGGPLRPLLLAECQRRGVTVHGATIDPCRGAIVLAEGVS
jgi:glucosamine kinase